MKSTQETLHFIIISFTNNCHYLNFYCIPLGQVLNRPLQAPVTVSIGMMLSLVLQLNSEVLHNSGPQLHQMGQVLLPAHMHDEHYQDPQDSSMSLGIKSISDTPTVKLQNMK